MRSYSRDKNVVLKVCSLFCGLDFVCALSFCGLLTKNVVLTQRYPKHAVLKMLISQPQQPLQTPSFAQHIIIGLATFHYNLTPSPLIVVAPHSLKLSPNFAIFQKFSLFRVVHWQIHFFLLAQKYPFFNPQNSTYIRATDLQTSVLRSTDSVDSSDTLSFAISPKLGEL